MLLSKDLTNKHIEQIKVEIMCKNGKYKSHFYVLYYRIDMFEINNNFNGICGIIIFDTP